MLLTFTSLLQYLPCVPTTHGKPVAPKRSPGLGNLSGEAKAPTPLPLVQLASSAANSVLKGILYPLGQGLLIPFKPCHKLLFCVLRQL